MLQFSRAFGFSQFKRGSNNAHFSNENRNSSGKLKRLVQAYIVFSKPFTNATLIPYNANWLKLRNHETEKWTEK